MNKKKQIATTTGKAATSASENDEIAKKIGETMSILKGGKVVKITKPTTGRGESVI